MWWMILGNRWFVGCRRCLLLVGARREGEALKQEVVRCTSSGSQHCSLPTASLTTTEPASLEPFGKDLFTRVLKSSPAPSVHRIHVPESLPTTGPLRKQELDNLQVEWYKHSRYSAESACIYTSPLGRSKKIERIMRPTSSLTIDLS